MFCNKCRFELPDDSEFCSRCGAKVTPLISAFKKDAAYEPLPLISRDPGSEAPLPMAGHSTEDHRHHEKLGPNPDAVAYATPEPPMSPPLPQVEARHSHREHSAERAYAPPDPHPFVQPQEAPSDSSPGRNARARAEEPAREDVPSDAELHDPDFERELWNSVFSGKAMILVFVLCGLGVVAYIILGALISRKWFWIVGAVPSFGFLLYYLGKFLYYKISVEYRMTSQRIFFDHGLLFKKHEELELIRVDDVTVEQNLIGRLFDVGDITVKSSDETHPDLELAGVANPYELKELVRGYVKRTRRKAVHLEQI